MSVFEVLFLLIADEGVFAYDKTHPISPGRKGVRSVTCAQNSSDCLKGFIVITSLYIYPLPIMHVGDEVYALICCLFNLHVMIEMLGCL